MDEYDRWYRSYRRRKAIAEHIGIFLAGFGLSLAIFVLYVLIVTAVGR
jgi:hypothetical protein